MKKLTFALAGCGHLGTIVARAYADGFLEEFEMVAAYSKTKEKSDAIAKLTGCKACTTIEEVLDFKPDYVVEAASVKLVKEIAVDVLSKGSNLTVLSIGAFADTEFYEKTRETAAAHNTRVHIASGAVGGFDVLRTISLMGHAKSGIETRKGPDSLRGTSVFSEELMSGEEAVRVFEGNAKEAIALFPTKVNVAVATSLATIGPEDTTVNIFSVPGMAGDDHCITSEIDGVRAVVDIYSRTSDIAGWSVVALLKNLVSPIAF